MTDQQPEFLYRDLDATLKAILMEMSNWGFIYLGRTGAGLTQSFRRAYFKMGTKAIRTEAAKYIGDDGIRVLEVIAIEGPRWVSYKRIEDAFYGLNPFQRATETTETIEATTIKKKNNKKKKPPSDEEIMEELRKILTTTKNNNKKNNNKGEKALS